MLLGLVPLLAQRTDPKVSSTFQAETKLVLMPFHVLRNNKPVTGLSANAFELRVDGIVQELAFFEAAGHRRSIPIDVALLFDTSASIRWAEQLNPYVFDAKTLNHYETMQLAIYGFAVSWRRFSPLTRDLSELNRAADAVRTMRE